MKNKFIVRLKLLIDEPSSQNIIGWNKEGDTILIYDKTEFTKLIPLYFRATGFNSFVRQLNLYGFKKIKLSNHSKLLSAYRHDYFQRDHDYLLNNIFRINSLQSRNDASTQTCDTNACNILPNSSSKDLDQRLIKMESKLIEMQQNQELLTNKFNNQQQLILAALQTMNNKSNQSGDVQFKIIVKPEYHNGRTISNPQFPSIHYYNSVDSVSTNNSAQNPPQISQLTSTNSNATIQLQKHYDLISNNYNNNPNFNFPIFLDLDNNNTDNTVIESESPCEVRTNNQNSCETVQESLETTFKNIENIANHGLSQQNLQSYQNSNNNKQFYEFFDGIIDVPETEVD